MTSIRLLAFAAVLSSLAPAVANADGFATTNVQGLVGFGFEDSLLGYDTPDGPMETLTVNHFSTWAWGDNFFFADLNRGDFADGTTAKIYAEWHPRLSLTRPFGKTGPLLGIIRDVFLAGEVNHGDDFYAYLAGVSADFELPGANLLGLSLYYRYDRFAGSTWQVSPFWTVPFGIGPVPFVFTGFLDLSGAADNTQVDVLAQPQLLVDVLAPFGGAPNKLLVGIEWYLHYNQFIEPKDLVSAPQAMVQWTWH